MTIFLFLIFIFIGLYFFLSKMLLPFVRFWGTSGNERTADLPGTDTVKNHKITSTHAITVHAPASVIWMYLVQIGQNKAGFYSYRWLENWVGCEMPDIQEIIPEFQKIKLGDKVFLHPKAPPLSVTALIPERVLGLEGWFLFLNPINENETRFITRGYDWRLPQKGTKLIDKVFSGPFFDIAHFIMERKMLFTIKKLAEARVGIKPAQVAKWTEKSLS